MHKKRKYSASFNYIDTCFSAKPLDKETGLYNFPQRYYDSRNVKWMTLDPIGPLLMTRRAGEIASLNLYNYGGNNPVMYHDPEGLEDNKKTNEEVDITKFRAETPKQENPLKNMSKAEQKKFFANAIDELGNTVWGQDEEGNDILLKDTQEGSEIIGILKGLNSKGKIRFKELGFRDKGGRNFQGKFTYKGSKKDKNGMRSFNDAMLYVDPDVNIGYVFAVLFHEGSHARDFKKGFDLHSIWTERVARDKEYELCLKKGYNPVEPPPSFKHLRDNGYKRFYPFSLEDPGGNIRKYCDQYKRVPLFDSYDF